MIAPVGQTSRQLASLQCLQTSDIISHALPLPAPTGLSCDVVDELDVPPVLRVEAAGVVVAVAEAPARCRGSSFHCLQATSQALQPMQTLVSVKNP